MFKQRNIAGYYQFNAGIQGKDGSFYAGHYFYKVYNLYVSA